MKKLFALLMVLSITLYVFAQVPQKMSYQCVIRNSSGALVANQGVGVRITILQGSASGTVVYQETYSPNPVTNVNGLLTIEIGGGIPVTGIFSSINWGAGPYFLRTESDPAGGINYTITGTSQLLSVSYALHAETVENGDNWGTQATVTDATLTGNGTASSPMRIAQQTASSGQVLKWSGSTWLPGNDLLGGSLWSQNGSNIFFNTGKVGVAKDPGVDSRQFQVIGGGNVAIAAENSTVSFPSVYAKNSTAAGYAALFENISGPVARFNRNIVISDGSQGLGKVLTSDANGVTSWQVPETNPWLKIATNIYYDAGWVGIGTSNIVTPLAISNANNTCYIQLFDNQGTGGMRMGAYAGDLALFNDNIDRNMRFSLRTATEYKQIMTLVALTQRVGINTTAPPYALSVLGGDVSIHSDNSGIAANDGLRLGISNNATDQSAWIWNYENGDLYFGTNNAERMRIDQSGNLGIGTNSPTQRLDVNGVARIRGMMTGVVATTVYRTSDGTLITGASDARLKENILPLKNSLKKVMKLNGVTFTWKADPNKNKSIGFIAQEFEKVIPELVFTNEADGYKGINYAEVNALLVEAIKEQQFQIEYQQKQIDELKSFVNKIITGQPVQIMK